jgi:hypothetical protein
MTAAGKAALAMRSMPRMNAFTPARSSRCIIGGRRRIVVISPFMCRLAQRQPVTLGIAGLCALRRPSPVQGDRQGRPKAAEVSPDGAGPQPRVG